MEFAKAAWTAPVSNEPVAITFRQLVKRTDPLRTGSYSRTLTFTLSTSRPSCGRGGGGAPCSGRRRRGSRARCRRRWRSLPRARRTSSSTACSATARISTSSGESCSISVPASMRRDEVRVERQDAVEAQHVGDEVVGEQRQAVQVPAVREPLRARGRRRRSGRACRAGRPGRRRARRRTRWASARARWRAPRPCPSARTPRSQSPTRSPSSRRLRSNRAISGCSGSWPSVAAISARVSAFSSGIVHGPRSRSPFSTVRKPDSPGGLASVGNHPLPKLIALSCSEKAARSSSSAPSSSAAGGESDGSPRA